MPSPAETLAQTKQRQRPPRNHAPYRRKKVWICGVRAEREKLRLAMRDVAIAVNLSLSSLHAIETGGDLCLTTATRLAEFFGLGLEELWKRAPVNADGASR